MFELLGVAAKAKPCKGMAGLIEEGQEVIEEGEEKDDLAADLGAHRGGAESRALRDLGLRHGAHARAGRSDGLTSPSCSRKSLAEEEIADNLLTQIARELMGQARTGTSKAPKLVAVREGD